MTDTLEKQVLQMHDYLIALQTKIVNAFSEIEGKEFSRDFWGSDLSAHNLGGNGCSIFFEAGNVFEKVAINFSHVMGQKLPPAASLKRPELAGQPFIAMGVSLVVHPYNPWVPSVHMNVRFFSSMAQIASNQPTWWFGGGIDLTPYYGIAADCIHFHSCCKNALEPFGDWVYPEFKQACDAYFYLPHRKEPRGIGGIFYDDWQGPKYEPNFEQGLLLTQSVGNAFLLSYIPILERRKNTPYTKEQRQFQALRRSRYVEFNLLFDRGTLFGLQSGGRVESILISMPPIASWSYNWRPKPGSLEESLYTDFLIARDWV